MTITNRKRHRIKERKGCRNYCIRYLKYIKHPLLSENPSPSNEAIMDAVARHLCMDVQGRQTRNFIIECVRAIDKSEPGWERKTMPVYLPATTPIRSVTKVRGEVVKTELIEAPKRFLNNEQKYAEWVNTKDFLFSPEWKKLRYEVLAIFGRRCMCCGSTTRICVDHIKPRKRYPHLALDINNLQILFGDCNEGKGNWDETDFRTRSAFVLTGTC
jgi:5-methylcytosine-specific restriction endonuclease McrA